MHASIVAQVREGVIGMPIDYSRFDLIGGSDDDDEGKNVDVDFPQILRDFCNANANRAPESMGVDPYSDDDDPFHGDDCDFDEGNESQSLDWGSLNADAHKHLVHQLITCNGALSTPRRLLLEAELHLHARRHRPALVAALALKLCTARSATVGPPEEWSTPARAVEMICAYQLGDRNHASETRNCLDGLSLDNLSKHLRKRFTGTCEVIDLMQQFLGYVKTMEKEKQNTKGHS